MKLLASILIATLAAVPALAKCPNNCNSHGRCGVDDLCLCFPGFTGFDCSERSCPAAEAWAVNDEVDPHTFVECSNRGICDRETGECRCSDGFSGAACERNACPNDCSGNGRCRMIQDFPNYEQDATLSWDEKAIQACLCDGGWAGPDCSLRLCPTGDDPVTQCDRDDLVEQVQQIRVFVSKKLDAASTDTPEGLSDLVAIIGDEFFLSFKDSLGRNFTTASVNGLWGDNVYSSQDAIVPADISTYSEDADAASRLEAALEGLPNFAIRDVTVSHSSAGVSGTYIENKFLVTFHHLNEFQNTYGAQNLLQCHVEQPCPAEGCQPRARQSYLAAIATNDGAGGAFSFHTPADLEVAAASTSAPWVRIHRDSVLTCPENDGVAESCSTTNANRLSGALLVAYISSSTTSVDGQIWVKGMGANNADMLDLHDSDITTDDAWNQEIDVATAPETFLINNGYTYVGEVTSSNYAKIDVSAVIPNTFIELADVANKATVSNTLGAAIFYEPAECSVTDVTEDATSGAEVGISNADVENIECSGRGECDRGNGICRCFEGYSGIACENQNTVL